MPATLDDIRTKVRRITRTPSIQQMTDIEINEYINNFIVYDLPHNIQMVDLRRTLTFYTRPYVGLYETNTVDPTDPLYNFKQRYIDIFNPLYVAGFPGVMTQSREMFWSMYPQQYYVNAIPTLGNGVQRIYAGTLSYKPIIQGTLSFNSKILVGLNQVGMTVADVPNYINGRMMTTGQFRTPDGAIIAGSFINYVTGDYEFEFPAPPMANAPIYSEYQPYTPGRPYNMLYYNSTFNFRPIPDTCYQITMDVTVKPTELIDDGDMPDIDQWWQYISYGASKRIFEDRMDLDSVQLIMNEFENQQALCLRKTIIQNSARKAVTIYNQPTNFRYGYGWPSDWGGH